MSSVLAPGREKDLCSLIGVGKEGLYREALLVHVVAVHAGRRVLLGVLGVGVGRGGWCAEGEAEQREEKEREVRQAHFDASVEVDVVYCCLE